MLRAFVEHARRSHDVRIILKATLGRRRNWGRRDDEKNTERQGKR